MEALAGRARVAVLALASLALAACGLVPARTTIHYRLTVEVETPEGLRSGSSVIEVRISETGEDYWANPEARGQSAKLRGEAVAVELPDGRVLFALLRSEDMVDAAAWWPFRIAANPCITGEYSAIRNAEEMQRSGASGELPWGSYPMLVTFGDLADPTSVELVDPDDLAATFGEGVRLKRVTVEFTDDLVTNEIEKTLPWIGAFRGRHFDGSESNFKDFTKPSLASRFSSGTFSTEFAR